MLRTGMDSTNARQQTSRENIRFLTGLTMGMARELGCYFDPFFQEDRKSDYHIYYIATFLGYDLAQKIYLMLSALACNDVQLEEKSPGKRYFKISIHIDAVTALRRALEEREETLKQNIRFLNNALFNITLPKSNGRSRSFSCDAQTDIGKRDSQDCHRLSDYTRLRVPTSVFLLCGSYDLYEGIEILKAIRDKLGGSVDCYYRRNSNETCDIMIAEHSIDAIRREKTAHAKKHRMR